MDRKYEVLVLLSPTLEQNNLDKIVKDIESKMGGTIVKKEEWGKKKLAYQIQHHDEATYVLYYVETTPDKIVDLKEYIAINKKEILRPLILMHEKAWPFDRKTSAALKFPERRGRQGQRPDRNARPRPIDSERKVASSEAKAKPAAEVKPAETPKKEAAND